MDGGDRAVGDIGTDVDVITILKEDLYLRTTGRRRLSECLHTGQWRQDHWSPDGAIILLVLTCKKIAPQMHQLGELARADYEVHVCLIIFLLISRERDRFKNYSTWSDKVKLQNR